MRGRPCDARGELRSYLGPSARTMPVLTRLLYLDLGSGAAGDMLLAGLLDLGAPIAAVEAAVAAVGLSEEVILRVEERRAGAFRASHLTVEITDRARPRQVADVLAAIADANLPDVVRDRGRRTIERLAGVESRLHGVPLEQLHLHELSAADTLTDVAGFWAACAALGVDEIHASPVNVGAGEVRFSHGRFRVPAPATAELLRGVPVYGGDEADGELTTPTAAAIIAGAVSRFGALPAMNIERIGYAVGHRLLNPPKLLRCYVGSAA